MVQLSGSLAALVAALVSIQSTVAAPTSSGGSDGNYGAQRKSVEVQAHRGGLGVRPESTLYAFAHALEIGVDVLEMDTVFTKDGVPVIWHDHQISASKCNDTTGKFVGQYIVNLTLAEVKTLDCGSQQISGHPQQKLFPGAQIQTLEEILSLVSCVGDKSVAINLETKLDPLTPNQTFGPEKYISDLVPILQKHNMDKRTTIQSFDWRTLIGIKKAFPKTQTVALADATTITPDDGRGVSGYPWLGGLKLEDFGGDWVKAAKSIGASIISPDFAEAGATVNSPTYKPFLTREMVEKAKKLGMSTVPWTVDDESSIEDAILKGVDGVISNYPERVIAVANTLGLRAGKKGNKVKDQCLKSGGARV